MIMVQEYDVNRAEGDVDKIVQKRFFPSEKMGVFIDVGAARPDFLSVSSLYRATGWKIIAIEPNPDFCKLHEDLGHEVLQYACGDHDEDDVEFSVVDSHGISYEKGNVSFESFSSLGIKESYANLTDDLDVKKIKVNLRKLDTLLKTYAPNIASIDILSIDVEGWELEVIDGLDVEKYQPRVMIVENLFNERKYSKYMKDINYVLWKRIYPNDVYVRNDILIGIEKYTRSLYQKYILCCRK